MVLFQVLKGRSDDVFISQIVRYARVNCSFKRFLEDIKKLVKKLINQHFEAVALRKRFQVFIGRRLKVVSLMFPWKYFMCFRLSAFTTGSL